MDQNEILNTEFVTFKSTETFYSLRMLITTPFHNCGSKNTALEHRLNLIFIRIIILSGPTSNPLHFGDSATLPVTLDLTTRYGYTY